MSTPPHHCGHSPCWHPEPSDDCTVGDYVQTPDGFGRVALVADVKPTYRSDKKAMTPERIAELRAETLAKWPRPRSAALTIELLDEIERLRGRVPLAWCVARVRTP